MERREKFERALARSLSDLIPLLKDPRIPVVTTVERVRLNADFSQAKVLVSTLGGPEELESLRDALSRAGGFLQRELARDMDLRRTPRLSFHTDPTEVL